MIIKSQIVETSSCYRILNWQQSKISKMERYEKLYLRRVEQSIGLSIGVER